jgi:DNA-binding PadR family transcriptional regulator
MRGGSTRSKFDIESLYESTPDAQPITTRDWSPRKWNGWPIGRLPLYPYARRVSNAGRWGGGGNLGNRDLIGGFVRLHVLHHANAGPIFGIGIIERLAFHGYVLSPGTLYPILHGLERDGLLRSRTEVVGKKRRRVYEITAEGQKTLVLGKARLWELFKEVFERELSPDTAGHVEKALRVAMVKASQRPGSSRVKKKSAAGKQ